MKKVIRKGPKDVVTLDEVKDEKYYGCIHQISNALGFIAQTTANHWRIVFLNSKDFSSVFSRHSKRDCIHNAMLNKYDVYEFETAEELLKWASVNTAGR